MGSWQSALAVRRAGGWGGWALPILLPLELFARSRVRTGGTSSNGHRPGACHTALRDTFGDAPTVGVSAARSPLSLPWFCPLLRRTDCGLVGSGSARLGWADSGRAREAECRAENCGRSGNGAKSRLTVSVACCGIAGGKRGRAIPRRSGRAVRQAITRAKGRRRAPDSGESRGRRCFAGDAMG